MVAWEWSYLWYIGGVTIGIIFTIWLVRTGRGKKRVLCDHDFVPMGTAYIQEKLRLIMRCKKCGQPVHVHVPSRRQLKEKEDAFYERYYSDRREDTL